MRSKRFIQLLLLAGLLLPTLTRAIPLTLQFEGLFLHGLGVCTNAPSGCTDPGIPVGINQNIGEPGYGLPYDQVQLTATAFSFDSQTGPFSFVQPYVFFPGDTGAGSVGFTEHFSLSRTVTLLDASNAIIDTQTLVQAGSILVGMFEDTLTIAASDPLLFTLPGGGTLRVALGSATITAGIDPPGDIPGAVGLVPLPPTIFLLAIGLMMGLAAMRLRRRPLAAA